MSVSAPLYSTTQTVLDVNTDEYRVDPIYLDRIAGLIPTSYMCPSRTPSREQGLCGSCWAFSIVHTFEDRLLYFTEHQTHLPKNIAQPPVLSVAQLLFCDWNDDVASRVQRVRTNPSKVASVTCFGNSILSALRYLYVFGIPTEECVPMSLRTLNADIRDMDEVREIPYCASITSMFEDVCADYDMYSSGEVFGTPSIRYRISNIYTLYLNICHYVNKSKVSNMRY